MQKASELDDNSAFIYLGDCFERRTDGKQNFVLAYKCYVIAASNGFADGQFNLARCYEHGIGVEKDLQKAKQYYEKAAENGSNEAAKRLKTNIGE